MERKRRVEISVLNTLFCLIVIFIHIISYPVAAFSANTPEYNVVMIPWRLCSFVVQGFVMLSGVKLFLNKKENLSFGAYLKGRIKGVIVPYSVCFAVYYLCFFLVYDYTFDAGFILKKFITGDLVCHLYFIPIIFQFDLLFPLWRRLVGKCSPKAVIPIAILFSMAMESFFPCLLGKIFLGFNFIYNDRLFTTYLSYWLIGCYIGKNYDKFCSMLKKYYGAVCIAFALSLIAVIGFSYLAYNQLAYIPWINLVHNLYVLLVCVFLYGTVLKVPPLVWEKIPLLFKIDRASFYIYLYHMLAVLLAEWFLNRVGICAQGTAFVIRALFAYGLTLPVCIMYQKLSGFVKSKRLQVREGGRK